MISRPIFTVLCILLAFGAGLTVIDKSEPGKDRVKAFLALLGFIAAIAWLWGY